jgi:hypothetical protein
MAFKLFVKMQSVIGVNFHIHTPHIADDYFVEDQHFQKILGN